MSTGTLLDARASQLETGAESPPAPAGRAAIRATAVAAGVLAAGVAWSAVIVAHFMPMCVPW